MKKIILLPLLMAILLSGCGSQKKIEEKTLTIWTPLSSTLAAEGKNLGDTELYKTLQKRTGIKVKFIHPKQGQEESSLKLLLASGNLPDIIEWNWVGFEGGPSRALNDGYIIELNDHIAKYAKNLNSYLKLHPDVDKLVKTDSGSYYVFPFIRGGEELLVSQGPAIRSDYLKKLNLLPPTTIDEWTEVLRKLKTIEGVQYPLTFEKDYETSMSKFGLHSAYRINKFFYLDGGKVKFGALESGYKEYLMKLNQWYQEGLLDPNIAFNDASSVENRMITGESAAVLTNAGGGFGKYFSITKGKDFDITAVPYPTLNKGDRPFIGQRDYAYTPDYGSVITTSCKDVQTAIEWLDYAYGEEGHSLFNFGIENVTYTKEGTHYRYTEMVLNNPEGKGIDETLSNYTRVTYGGPFVQDPQYIIQCMVWPQQKDALRIWANTDASEHLLPLLTPTASESEELARILNNIKVCINDNVFDFITDKKSFNEFESFQNQLYNLNIERAIEIQQTALERYVNR